MSYSYIWDNNLGKNVLLQSSLGKNILKNYLDSKLDSDKKYKLCEMFAKYDQRIQMSYKSQIHYEALFMDMMCLIHN